MLLVTRVSEREYINNVMLMKVQSMLFPFKKIKENALHDTWTFKDFKDFRDNRSQMALHILKTYIV